MLVVAIQVCSGVCFECSLKRFSFVLPHDLADTGSGVVVGVVSHAGGVA